MQTNSHLHLWFLWWIWPGASPWEGEAARQCCGCPTLRTWTEWLAGPCRRRWQRLQDKARTRVIQDKKTTRLKHSSNVLPLAAMTLKLKLDCIHVECLPGEKKWTETVYFSVWHCGLMETARLCLALCKTQNMRRKWVYRILITTKQSDSSKYELQMICDMRIERVFLTCNIVAEEKRHHIMFV